ncbi:MAG: ComF family protein [Candidatus Sericytochromatia bacterium]|nr:ComF family protein [Candidatus Sericytochromatia bacterium]
MFLRNFLLKSKCLVCNRSSSICICKGCSNQFQSIPEPHCQICKSIEIVDNNCQECLRRPPLFSDLIVLGIYSGLLKSLIYNYKYEGIKEYSKPFADLLAKKISYSFTFKFDYITSVPIHHEKLKSRGFNQADLLARDVAKNLRINYLEIFDRSKETKAQFGLSGIEREKNIKDAFGIITNKNIKDKNILIVDDIFTTGSTLQELSKLALDKGVNKLYLATIARSIK